MPLFSDAIDAAIILLGAICGTIYSITTANRRARFPQEEEAHIRLGEMKKAIEKSKEHVRGCLSVCEDMGGEVSVAENGALSLSKKEGSQ